MSLPTFSVLLANFNKGPYIHKSLQAILSQSLRPDEIIIIDDCSTDNSVAIIMEILEQEPEIRFIQNEKNFGACYTLDRIVREASCDYFHLVGTDDFVLPGYYEKSMNLVRQHPQAGLCSAIVQCKDMQGENLGLDPSHPFLSKTECFVAPDDILKNYQKYGGWYNGAVTFWRREPYIELGGFAPAELGSLTDTFKFFQLAFKYGVCFIPEILHTWTVTSSGFSAKARQDPDHALSQIALTEEVMTNHQGGLFSPDFIEEFKRRELATLGNTILKKMDSDLEISLSFLIQALPENNVADRVVIRFTQLLMRVQNIFLKVYLGFRLRRFNGIFLLRMIYHAKDCMKKIIK
jgi:hypothetical protein